MRRRRGGMQCECASGCSKWEVPVSCTPARPLAKRKRAAPPRCPLPSHRSAVLLRRSLQHPDSIAFALGQIDYPALREADDRHVLRDVDAVSEDALIVDDVVHDVAW